jgi:hypothetical protein
MNNDNILSFFAKCKECGEMNLRFIKSEEKEKEVVYTYECVNGCYQCFVIQEEEDSAWSFITTKKISGRKQNDKILL